VISRLDIPARRQKSARTTAAKLIAKIFTFESHCRRVWREYRREGMDFFSDIIWLARGLYNIFFMISRELNNERKLKNGAICAWSVFYSLLLVSKSPKIECVDVTLRALDPL
jgi:hypothetical protein